MITFTPSSRRLLIVLLHVFVWVVVFILPAYLLFADSNFSSSFLIRNYVQIAMYALLFYCNYLILIPKLYFRGKRKLYFLSSVMLLIVTTILISYIAVLFSNYFHDMMPPPPDDMPGENPKFPDRPHFSAGMPAYNFLLTGFLLSGIALGISFFDQAVEKEKQRKDAEREKLNSELAYLKNQISPHFFFNTLNNIYSLVQSNVQNGQKAILQLSKLMRYLLYETEKGSVPLSEEIEFMKTYLELMKLRLTNRIELDVQFPEDYPDMLISPLLFLPFIENAFKYGISYRSPSFIRIKMRVADKEVNFECHNSLSAKQSEMYGTHSGIGLENVRKRLSLLYPGKHTLEVVADATAFHIKLTLLHTHD